MPGINIVARGIFQALYYYYRIYFTLSYFILPKIIIMLLFYKFNALVLFIIFSFFVHFSSYVQLYVAEFNVIFQRTFI